MKKFPIILLLLLLLFAVFYFFQFRASPQEGNTFTPDSVETIVLERQVEYHGEDVCGDEGMKFILSPDDQKAACITNTNRDEPDSALWLYDSTNHIAGVLEYCGTPCAFGDGVWISNDIFKFIYEYEDFVSEEVGYKKYMVEKHYDFTANQVAIKQSEM